MSETGPLLILTEEKEWRDHAGRDDVLIVSVTDGMVELPQFGVKVPVNGPSEKDLDDALLRALREMLTIFAALTELPDDFINTVEQHQLQLFETVIAPWVMKMVASNPDEFNPSRLTMTEAAGLVGA